MISKVKHKRKGRVAEEEIDQYCQSVENLLITINDSHRAKKGKKIQKTTKAYLPPDKDSWPTSDN